MVGCSERTVEVQARGIQNPFNGIPAFAYGPGLLTGRVECPLDQPC